MAKKSEPRPARYRKCVTCKGTGKRMVRNKNGSVTAVPCPACGGAGGKYLGNV